jgi:hypothetical protein
MFQGISKSSPYFPRHKKGQGAEDPRVGLLGLENMVHPASYLSLYLSISLSLFTYLYLSVCLSDFISSNLIDIMVYLYIS